MKIGNSSHYQAIQTMLKKQEDEKDNLNVEGEPDAQVNSELSNTISVDEGNPVQNVSGSSLSNSHQPPHFVKNGKNSVCGYSVWLTDSHGNETMWCKTRDEWENVVLRKQALEEAEKEGLKLDKVYELTPKMLDVVGIPESKREEAIHLLADS